jgi:hypothetical protein
MAPNRKQSRPLPGEVWTTRYEDLRRQVVEEHRDLDRGAGLALLAHRGVVAWMRAWPEDIGPWPPRGEQIGSADVAPAEPIYLSTDLRHQVTLVLVNMVLGHQERATSSRG